MRFSNPSNHRISRTSEGILLAGIAASSILLLLSRLGLIHSSRATGFLLILVTVVLSNCFWWSWVHRVIVTKPGPGAAIGRSRSLLSYIWTGYCLLMLLPFLLLLVGARRTWDAFPVPILSWTIVWYLLLAPLGCVAAVVFLVQGIVRRVRGGRSPAQPADGLDPPMLPAAGAVREAMPGHSQTAPSGEEHRISRRAALAQAVASAAPLVITGGSVLAGRHQEGRFLIRRVALRVPSLPERLKGLTITHLSDLHVGRFFRPEHLPRVVDTANGFRSDIVAITGDIIDHSNDFLPAAQQALAQIEARYGRYVVIGNHDLMDFPRHTEQFLAGHEPGFLRDGLIRVNIGGEMIQVAGLSWARSELPTRGDPGYSGRAQAALNGADPDRFTLALAHHPHAFESLAACGANLVLSGHTHGGQIMLTPPGFRPPLGAGNLMFRYIHGEYALGNSRLYVSAGVGNWFPIRVNAPAEVVQIRLV